MKAFVRAALAIGAILTAGTAQAQIALGDQLEIKYFFPDLSSEIESSGVFTYAGAGQAVLTQYGSSTLFLYDNLVRFSEEPGCGEDCTQSDGDWNGAVLYDYTNAHAFAGWGLKSDTVGITSLLLTDDHIGVNWQNVPAQGAVELGAGGVPEPASWALMLSGFGLAGVALRRQKSQAARWSTIR